MAEADNELVITLDADEYAQVAGMARQMDMTVEALASWAIERWLEQHQAGVIDVSTGRH